MDLPQESTRQLPYYKRSRTKRTSHLRADPKDKRTYTEVRHAILEDMQYGLTFREMLEKEGLNPWELKRHLGYLKGMHHKGCAIGAQEHVAKVIEDAWMAVQAGCNSNTEYNRAKVGATVLKGVGIFKSSDDKPNLPGSGTIIENAQIFVNMSPEDQEKLREEYRRHIAGTSEGRGVVGRLSLESANDTVGAIVVDAEVDPHQE